MDNNMSDLKDWALDKLPGAHLAEINGEVVIHTGLTEAIGGYLYPLIVDEETDEIEQTKQCFCQKCEKESKYR